MNKTVLFIKLYISIHGPYFPNTVMKTMYVSASTQRYKRSFEKKDQGNKIKDSGEAYVMNWFTNVFT